MTTNQRINQMSFQSPELLPFGWTQFGVIAWLDPAIHPLHKMLHAKQMGPRVKPARDGVGCRSH
jgi:hypothetical protein